MVGVTRLELTTPRSQSECATKLRYTPNYSNNFKYKSNVYLFLEIGKYFKEQFWGGWWDLNPRHPGPQPGALPTELHPPFQVVFKYTVLQIKIKKTFH